MNFSMWFVVLISCVWVLLPCGRAMAAAVNIPELPVSTVQVGDIAIGYRTIGTGTPLLLITGYGSTMDLWPPQLIAALSEQHCVIMFDNRGAGYSGDSSAEYSLELFADDAAGLLHALAIDKAEVLGWSMGSYVAQELALRHPAAVDKLILYASGCGGSEATPPSAATLKILADSSGTPREQGQRLLSLLFPADWLALHPDSRQYFPMPRASVTPAVMQRQQQAIIQWPGTYARLHGIACPTLIVAGMDDVIAPPQNAQLLAQRLSGAWLANFRDAGHGLMYQYPAKLAALCAVFLDD